MGGQQRRVRVVAIDLDGTLLRSDKSYDAERFERLLDRCLDQGVRVVIASGRQYLSMSRMFARPELLSFVADNGAVVVDHGELVHAVHVDDDLVREVVDLVDDHPELKAFASAPERAWAPADCPPDLVALLQSAYANLVLVDSLTEIDEPVTKFALGTLPEQSERLARALSEQLGGRLTAVTTGHQGFDLIVPGRHKAWGMGLLLERWGIGFDELAAFGDSGNDVELLAAAGQSWAMAEADPRVVEVAGHRAPSNDESGVLAVLEELIG